MQVTKYIIKANISNNIRIALVADLHDKPCGDLLPAIKEQHPDIIAIPGDFIYRTDNSRSGLAILKEAVKLAPVFYSLGNHEHFDKKDIDEISKTGVAFLDDSFVRFKDIYIGGLTSGFILKRKEQGIFKESPAPDLGWLDRFASLDRFKLLLCHHPEYYPEYIKQRDIDLTLSGHAHGGQWRIFGQGIFAPGQGLFPKYTSGVHENRLIISRGLANNAGIPRIFNGIELVVIDLLPNK
jgi:hypothetical protein